MDASAATKMRTFDAVLAQAVAYSEAVYFARADVFADMCHDQFSMTLVNDDGTTQHWDKAAYLERVSGRTAFSGDASYEILGVDVAATAWRVCIFGWMFPQPATKITLGSSSRMDHGNC